MRVFLLARRPAPPVLSRLCFALAAIYPTIMLAVHIVGYRVWRRQFHPRGSLGQPPGITAIAVLAVSFLFLGGLVSAGIYWGLKDLPGCDARIASGRALVFAAVIWCAHIVGYRVWMWQFSPDHAEGGLAVYGPPMKTALLFQGIFLILAALVLDMGETWNATLVAMLAYWMPAGLIMARRLDRPTRIDLFFVRWGFLVIWLVTMVIGPVVWYRMEI